MPGSMVSVLDGFFHPFFFRGESIWMFSENSGFSPQIVHFNRIFHYFHHPFWGTPIFGNTPIRLHSKE